MRPVIKSTDNALGINPIFYIHQPRLSHVLGLDLFPNISNSTKCLKRIYLAMRVGLKAININEISQLYMSTSYRISCCPFLCYIISF